MLAKENKTQEVLLEELAKNITINASRKLGVS